MTLKKNNTKRSAAEIAAAATIIGAVFALEGGYVFNKNDPGGETNHGVTKAVAVDAGYTGPMRELTRETAAEIYDVKYIQEPGYDRILELSAVVGEELVDSAVNAGPARASRWFQTSLNQLNSAGGCPILHVDGKVGPATADAYKCLQRTRGAPKACQMTIKLMDAQQAQHYMSLVNSNKKFSNFIVGWVDHRIGNVDIKRCLK